MNKDEFDELRGAAFGIAYRMLGSVTEAEDVVQEGLLRLHRARAAVATSLGVGYLAAMAGTANQ